MRKPLWIFLNRKVHGERWMTQVFVNIWLALKFMMWTGTWRLTFAATQPCMDLGMDLLKHAAAQQIDWITGKRGWFRYFQCKNSIILIVLSSSADLYCEDYLSATTSSECQFEVPLLSSTYGRNSEACCDPDRSLKRDAALSNLLYFAGKHKLTTKCFFMVRALTFMTQIKMPGHWLICHTGL